MSLVAETAHSGLGESMGSLQRGLRQKQVGTMIWVSIIN